MKIKNHLLYYDDDTLVSQIQIPHTNYGGALYSHQAIILHFTQSLKPEWTIAAFKTPNKQKSAHLLFTRDVKIYQFLPFNLVGYHCGSWWNLHSIGIEIDNLGAAANKYPIPVEDKVLLKHWKQTTVKTWEVFKDPVIAKVVETMRALQEIYGAGRLLGHEDVISGNDDPGPAFPWGRVMQETLKDLVYPPVPPPPSNVGKYRVTARNGLNVRSSPGIQNNPSNIVGTLMYNSLVVVYEISSDGEWARIGDDRWASTYYLEKVV